MTSSTTLLGWLIMTLCLTAPAAGQDANRSAPPGGAPQAENADGDRRRAAALDARVRAEVAAFRGKVSLYAKNLDTGEVYSLGGDERVRTASTIKLAVMVEAFARVAAGKAGWADELVLTKAAKVSGSGVLQHLSDGARVTLRDAVTLMIVLSDNTATNLVVDLLTADAVNERMESLGLRETRLMRKVMGGGESREGKLEENKRFGLGRSSPREMALLLERLERGEVVSPSASREMIGILRKEQSDTGLFRALWKFPAATKSGALDRLRSDVGIIYHPRGRIVVAATCDDMPEVEWSPDNPALLLLSRLSVILVEGLGK